MIGDRRAPRLDPRNPGRLDFDARDLAVVPEPQVPPDTELAEKRLALLDLPQTRRGDCESVLHAARETGRRGRVPRWQPERARRGPDLRFRQSHLGERRRRRRLTSPCSGGGPPLCPADAHGDRRSSCRRRGSRARALAPAARAGSKAPFCSRSSGWSGSRDSSHPRARASGSRRGGCRTASPHRLPPATALRGTMRSDRSPPACGPYRAPAAARRPAVPNPRPPNSRARLRESCGPGCEATPWAE